MTREIDISLATILNKEARGESSLYISAFSDTLGLFAIMKRASSKGTSRLPDIFDDITGNATSKTSDSVKFLGEFEILESRRGIALNYDAFSQASAICKCLLRNGRHLENSAEISQILRRALDTIAKGAPAKIARLKFMYLLAKNEGYPVKEDFYASLSNERANLFANIIKTPTNQCVDFADKSEEILDIFLKWIYARTDILE